jgi:chorismate synthase
MKPIDVEIRHLQGWDELESCVELQRITWGGDWRDLVPPLLLKVAVEAGGVLGGAFQDGSLVGFVFGLAGTREGRPIHWSHLLAVAPGARGRGIGGALKHWQRDRVLAARVDRMFWTYDPLRAGNAHLNLTKLGVTVVEYVEQMYGTEIDTAFGSDRLIVEWDLTGSRTGSGGDMYADTIVDPDTGDLPSTGVVGIGVPEDLDLLLADDEGRARAWRAASRRAFRQYLSAGWRVLGFTRRPRPHYLLSP